MEEENVKRKIITNDGMFLNAKCVLVEYTDIIRAPYLMIAEMIREDPTWIGPPIVPNKILAMNTDEFVNWYLLRRNANMLIDLIPKDKLSTVNFEQLNLLLDRLVDDMVVEMSPILVFQKVIDTLLFMDGMIVGDVLFYYPYDNPYVKKDIENLFDNKKAKFVSGSLTDIITGMPIDSTYVFSNMANINILLKTNHLDYSSIIMADDYGYNRLPDNSNYIIDLMKLNEKHPFKFNTFYATSSDEHPEDEEIDIPEESAEE